jgi:hypothetical protein
MMMSKTSVQISNVLASLLASFHVFCFQGHLTDRLTPQFHTMVMESTHPLNEKLFWYLSWTDEQLSAFMLAVNVINITSLIPRSTRTAGLLVNMSFFTLGLVGQIRTGEDVVPHLVLISTSAAAAWMRT